MKCKIICDLLPMYIDEVCSDETKELVEEHLKACPECRREYEQMKADISLNEAEDLDEKELMDPGRYDFKSDVGSLPVCIRDERNDGGRRRHL